MEFYKNNLKLFHNYFFVPEILHLGPYIIFVIMIESLSLLILIIV
jgi:hypothetical protein